MRLKVGDAVIDTACLEYGTGIIVKKDDVFTNAWRIKFENMNQTVIRADHDDQVVLDKTWNSPLGKALR